MFDRALLALPHAARAFALLVLCALVQAGTIIGQSLALAGALSNIWAGAAFGEQALAIAVFIGCFGVRHILVLVRDTLLDRYARTCAAELRNRLLHTIFCGSAGLAARVGSPVLADTAIQGVDQVESYIRVIMPKMAELMAITVPVLVCAFVLDWVSGIILLVLLPVAVLFMVLIGLSARARAERQYASYQVLSNHFIDTLRGVRTLRAFGVAQRYADTVYAVSERFRKATMRTMGVAMLSGSVLDLIATCGIAAVSIMLGFRLLDGSLMLFTGLAVLVLSPEYFKPLREFASDFHASLDGKNALASIQRIIGNGAESSGDATNPSVDSTSASSWTAESHLALDNVCFAYDETSVPAIHDASFDLHGFEHVAIVGPSGAGKSTLVDILGGFKSPTTGTIGWDGRQLNSLDDPAWQSQVIYIPQHPYIFHATLRDNIAFYSPDAPLARVQAAVHAMGLEQLVAELPDGLDTVIGEGGRTLSGGQAHRIALARAFLDPQRRILLFDEPTAHLDIETELELKQRMLPLMEGRLVVFATHRLHWLADMDRVIHLEGGKIFAEEPSDSEVPHARGGGLEAIAQGMPSPFCAAGEAPSPNCEAWTASSPFCEAEDTPYPQPGQESESAMGADGDSATSGAFPDANSGASSSSRRWILSYVRGNRKLLAAACALGVAAFACAAMLMFCSGYLIGYTAQPDALLIAIMMPMAFVQLFGIGRPVARYFQRLTSHDWVFRVTSDLRKRLYLAVERRAADPRYERTSGDYLGLLSEDIGHLQNLFLRVVMPVVVAIALIALSAIACAFFDLSFAGIVLVVMLVAAAVVPLAALGVSRNQAARAKRMTAQLYDTLTDNVMGSTDWVFAGRGAAFCRSNACEEARLRALQARVRAMQRAARLAISLLFAALACIAMMWAAGYFGGGPGAGGNWVIAFTLVVFPLAEAVLGLPEAAQSAESHMGALDRLQEAGASDPEDAAIDSRAEAGPVCTAPYLAFEDVSFAYEVAGSALNEAAVPVLKNFSLVVEPGQKIAILGRSGVGKSTMLALARGDITPVAGDVHVFGMAPDRISDVSRYVGVVAQDAYLFNQTLRQNVVLARTGISDDDVRDALVRVGLGPLLDSLPHGLDTLMGESGARFSGGERQRIALARILLSPAPLVLFDEPTVGLDPVTEHALFDAIFDTLADRTLVVVTHHLQEVDRFDRVIFIEDGCILLDGTPTDLARENLRYRQLLALDCSC